MGCESGGLGLMGLAGVLLEGRVMDSVRLNQCLSKACCGGTEHIFIDSICL